ncbi:MAG: TolC family protein [Candidatus Omnitrophica bacterium]|nr:TolC family protein [Candidatus Omnitrophota bacterium]
MAFSFSATGQDLQESEPIIRNVSSTSNTPLNRSRIPGITKSHEINLDPIEEMARWIPRFSRDTGYRLWDCLHISMENNRPLRNARDDLKVAQITLRERQEEFGNIYQLGAGAHYDENLAHTDYDRYAFSFGGTEGGVSGFPDGAVLSRRFYGGGTLSVGARSTYQSAEYPRYAPLVDNMGNPILDANGNPVISSWMADVRWFSEANLVITQPLLEGAGRVATTALRVQELERAAVNLELERFIQSVLADVIRRYLAVQRAVSLALVAQDSYQRALELFRLTQEKAPFTPADVAPLQLFRSEQQVTSTQQQFIDAKNSVDSSLIDLRLTLGVEPTLPIVLSGTDVPVMSPPPFKVDEAIQAALKRRPDLRSLQILIRQQELYFQVAQNDLLPNLDFSARMGFRDQDEHLSNSWSLFDYQDVGANLRLNLPLNLPSDKANYQRAQIRIRQATTDLQQKERLVVNEVDEAYRTQSTLLERIDVLRRNEELARKTFETMTGLAEYGQIDPFDIVQAQNDLTSAQASRVRAEIDYVIALAALDLATGLPISEVMARYSPLAPSGSQ